MENPLDPTGGTIAQSVAAHLADLTRAGLPLAPGLRALAQEVRSRRVAAALVRAADGIPLA